MLNQFRGQAAFLWLLRSVVLGMALCLLQAKADAKPLLEVEHVELVRQFECLDPVNEISCAGIRLVADLTGVDWLDEYLLRQLMLADLPSEVSSLPVSELKARIAEQAQSWVHSSYAELQSVHEAGADVLALDRTSELRYLYQRGHLAFFRQVSYAYQGGSHGVFDTRFLMMDLKARKRLHLQDILLPDARQAMAEALRIRYLDEYAEFAEGWLEGSDEEQLEKFMLDNFVFEEQGLTFVYPLYYLAPYAAGELRLTLAPAQYQWLLKPEYRLYAPGE